MKTYATADVVVTMNTQRFSHRKDSNLIVTFDRPLFAEVRIPITAYIRTDVVFNPGSVNFGAVEEGKSASKSVTISYAGRADWKIERLKINNSHLSGTIKQTSRVGGQAQYRLSVSLKPGSPPEPCGNR